MNDALVEHFCLHLEDVAVGLHVFADVLRREKPADECGLIDIRRDPAEDAVVFESGLEGDVVMADKDELRDSDKDGVFALSLEPDILAVKSELRTESVLKEQGATGSRYVRPEHCSLFTLLGDALDTEAQQDDLLMTLQRLNNLRASRLRVRAEDVLPPVVENKTEDQAKGYQARADRQPEFSG